MPVRPCYAEKLRGLQGLGVTSRRSELQQTFSSFTPYALLDNFVKSRGSLFDVFKNSVLRLASDTSLERNSAAAAAAGDVPATKGASNPSPGHREAEGATENDSKGASLKESFPDVFVILDRFPMGNQVASLQSLADIGAHFPDAVTLTKFHQFDSEKTHMSKIHEHLCDVQLRFIQQLSPIAALDVYKALAVLRLHPGNDVHDALFNTIVDRSDKVELPEIASFIQARMMLHPELDDHSAEAISHLLKSSLQRSKKRNVKDAAYVVHVLNLFVKYNLREEDVLHDASEYLKARVKSLSTSDLVSAVTAFARLEYPAGRFFDAVVVEVLHRGPEQFHLSELACLAAALTEIKHFDVMTDVLMDGIALTCQKSMQKLKFEELVDLLWSYAHHMHFHHDAKLLQSLAAGLVAKLDSVKHPSNDMCVKLCDIVSASDFGSENACRILTMVSSHSQSLLPKLNTTELLTVATGCRKARFGCEQLLASLRDAFDAQSRNLPLSDLCRVLNNFTSLNFHPGETLLDLSLEKTDMVNSLSPTEVSRLLWSLAFFDKLTAINCQPLFNHLQNFSRSNFNALDVQKILLAEKLILLSDSAAADDDNSDEEQTLIPEPLRSDLVSMWRERIYFTRSVSPFQQQVSHILTRMNIYHEAEALIDNGDLSVDFLLFPGATRSEDIGDRQNSSASHVVLECDGHRRCSIDIPRRPLGQTASFKKLLRAQGWKVHVISKDDWSKRTPSEQEQLLREILKLQ